MFISCFFLVAADNCIILSSPSDLSTMLLLDSSCRPDSPAEIDEVAPISPSCNCDGTLSAFLNFFGEAADMSFEADLIIFFLHGLEWGNMCRFQLVTWVLIDATFISRKQSYFSLNLTTFGRTFFILYFFDREVCSLCIC
mmetsp:Transcript_11085/g.17088  ORF Transcript_11085/g.17088 Transcript_11085/m.17088 type:complete len:140 (+) Transcript_11085:941-1360(+)